jgi:hypothetical protein
MLTLDEIKTRAPAAFATTPAAHCSPRYVMFPTIQAIELLGREGFLPVEARQDSNRGGEVDLLHAKHMIRFRALGVQSRKETAVGGLDMDIILRNSSDGRSKFSLNMGIFRKVCSNGMVAKVSGLNVVTSHKRISAESVLQRASEISKQSKPLFDKIKTWQSIKLTGEQRLKFAMEATMLRFDEKAGLYKPEDMIAVRREEDAEDNLWNVFNRAQESGMRGGITGANAAGRRVTSRGINSINGDMSFNGALWELAEKFAAAK